jgi:hypothetical protein
MRYVAKEKHVVDAYKWDGTLSCEGAPQWILDFIEAGDIFFGHKSDNLLPDTADDLLYEGPDGIMVRAERGDYIINDDGTFYTASAEYFEEHYEPLTQQA